MKRKVSWRTTAVGLFGLLLLLLGMALVYFGKTTLTEVGTFMALILPVLLGLLALVSKDEKVQSLTDAEVKKVETLIKKEEKKQ